MLLALLLALLLKMCPGSHGQAPATAADGFAPFPVLAAAHAHAFCSLPQSLASLVPAEAELQQVMTGGEGRSVTTTHTTHTATTAGALCCSYHACVQLTRLTGLCAV